MNIQKFPGLSVIIIFDFCIFHNFLTKAGFTPDSRSFSPAFVQQISGLQNYGCWCYFDENHGLGKSQPVDDIDNYCKQLHNNYECTIMDGCGDPWTIVYNAAPLYMSDVATVCQNLNDGNDCAIKVCTIESKFMQQILTWKMMGGYDGFGGFNPYQWWCFTVWNNPAYRENTV